MAGAYIEAYAYSEGGSGATCPIDTVQTFATLTGTYVRPSTPQRFSDLLASWQSAMNTAEPAGAPWNFYYNPATRRVTLETALGLYAWDPALSAQTSLFVGFTSYGGTGTSWTGAEPPTGRCELIGATVEPAEDWAQIELARYRHGRTAAVVWGNHQIHRITVHVDPINTIIYGQGWVQSGRIRVYQANSGAALNAYSATNPAGYVDGFVIGSTPVAQQSEGWYSSELLVGVPR